MPIATALAAVASVLSVVHPLRSIEQASFGLPPHVVPRERPDSMRVPSELLVLLRVVVG